MGTYVEFSDKAKFFRGSFWFCLSHARKQISIYPRLLWNKCIEALRLLALIFFQAIRLLFIIFFFFIKKPLRFLPNFLCPTSIPESRVFTWSYNSNKLHLMEKFVIFVCKKRNQFFWSWFRFHLSAKCCMYPRFRNSTTLLIWVVVRTWYQI